MRITPLDVRKQEFRKAVRGFDCDEVRAFLSTLADEYEIVLVDNKQIREQIEDQNEKIHEYQSMERNLRDTLMTAERLMKETRVNASKEGDLIVKDAEIKARQVLEECRLRTEELRRELVNLRKEKENYLARFKSLAEAQIQFVETHKTDFEDMDKRLVDIADSVTAGNSVTRRPSEVHAPIPAALFPDTDHPQAPVEGPDPFAGGPETPVPAPHHSEMDVWRDYSPGPEKSEEDVAGSIADLVSESLSESATAGDDEFVPPVVEPEELASADQKGAMPLPTVAAGPVLTNGLPENDDIPTGDAI